MKERKKKMEVEVKGDSKRWRCNLCNLVLGCCEQEEKEMECEGER